MKLELTRSDGGAVLVAGGRLTASVAARLRDALLEAFAAGGAVELALRDVEEADLTFVQLVCAAHRTAAARAVGFSVTGVAGASAVQRLLRDAGVSRADGCPPACALSGAAPDAAPGAARG